MWFAIFIIVCVAIMVDDARKDIKFMEELKKKLNEVEE
jgi:hypothetical protein